jgi:hypothetical protein
MSALFPLPSPSNAIGEGVTATAVTDEVLPSLSPPRGEI